MPSNKGGTKKGSRIPKTARNVGSRTGVDVLAGKNVRKDSRGMDNFEDYFTERDESDSSNVSILGGKHNVSNENVSPMQPKSPRKSSGKRTSSLLKKKLAKRSQKTPTEQESSDKEDLVTAGTRSRSFLSTLDVVKTPRLDKITSLLHGQQRLSFVASPKPSSLTKQASKTNQKQNSPKNPVTGQINDLQYDTSDEDLFEPIKLDWTLASKRLVNPVNSIKKAATSPEIQKAKNSPYSTPQSTVKTNKHSSLARRSLYSSQDENYIPEQLKLASSDEDSGEEPIHAPRKSPGSTNKKQIHHTGLEGRVLASKADTRLAEKEKIGIEQHNQRHDASKSVSEDRGSHLGGAKTKQNSLVRNLNATGWKSTEKFGKVINTLSSRSKSLQHDELIANASPSARPVSKVPVRKGTKPGQKLSRRHNKEAAEAPFRQQVALRSNDPKQHDINSESEKSDVDVAVRMSPQKRRSLSGHSVPESTVVQNIDTDTEVATKPGPKLRRRHHKEAATALRSNDPKQQDSNSESGISDVDVAVHKSPRKRRSLSGHSVPESNVIQNIGMDTEVATKPGRKLKRRHHKEAAVTPSRQQVALRSNDTKQHDSESEKSDLDVTVLISPRKHHSLSGDGIPESNVVHNSDTDTEVAASPPKKSRSQQQQLSSPRGSREVPNLMATTNKQHHRQAASPTKTPQAHSYPTAKRQEAAHDRSLSDSKTDERLSTSSPGTTKSKKSVEKLSPRRKLEMDDNINGSLDKERQMSDGKRGSPWSKQLKSATNFQKDKPDKKKKKRGRKTSAVTPKKALDDLPRKSAKSPNGRQEQTNRPKKSDMVTEKSVHEAVESLRRSKRNRVPVLARHIGQRIIYKRDENGLLVVDRIEEGSKYASKFSYKRTAKKKQPEKVEKSLVQQIDDSVLDKNEMDDVPLEAILVINPETNEEVYVDCIQLKRTFTFVGPNGEPIGRDDPMAICKPLEQKAFSSGIIVLRPRQEKGFHYVQNDAMIFWVLKGKLEVTVHETMVILQKMDNFFVPPGNKYNIKNLTDNSVELLFFQHKREN